MKPAFSDNFQLPCLMMPEDKQRCRGVLFARNHKNALLLLVVSSHFMFRLTGFLQVPLVQDVPTRNYMMSWNRFEVETANILPRDHQPVSICVSYQWIETNKPNYQTMGSSPSPGLLHCSSCSTGGSRSPLRSKSDGCWARFAQAG